MLEQFDPHIHFVDADVYYAIRLDGEVVVTVYNPCKFVVNPTIESVTAVINRYGLDGFTEISEVEAETLREIADVEIVHQRDFEYWAERFQEPPSIWMKVISKFK